MSQLRLLVFLWGALACVFAGETCLAQETTTTAPTITLVPDGVENTLADRCMSLLGLAAFIGIAWLLSTNRKRVDWRIVAWGTAQQFLVALIVLKTWPGRRFFELANDAFNALTAHTVKGAEFLFGNLVWNNVPTGSPDIQSPEMNPITRGGEWANTGAFFAFNVLPTIIFFSALMTLLYHWGLMQWIVRGFGWAMKRTMNISGAESLSTAGNIFLGQTEAPLLIKPYLAEMTRSELHCIMAGGFGTVAGGVLAAYVGLLSRHFPDIAGHLISASVMAAPAVIVTSKLMWPETEQPVTRGATRVKMERLDANSIDAAARGAGEGLTLALNVGAMLLAFIALISLANAMLSWSLSWFGVESFTLQTLLGWICAPIAWLMGIPWREAVSVGTLLGEKTVLNEFVAYIHLAQMIKDPSALSPRSVVIATYALCGFANFSSIAIQIGGIGGMVPQRRHELSVLGLRAMVAGTLANFMTACVVGVLL
jgi:CNT family concentrative nucleoside transporter